MNQEIEELRRVLERKKEERATIEREKAREEEKIEVVRSEFCIRKNGLETEENAAVISTDAFEVDDL